ncbi:tape measure protein [Escherichia coli]|uniref:tape measure protein n=1 Tax=Escherichia coli TaxID=562 RepID=UPI001F58B638|nr:tape measure protein [Escherichia coli]MCI2234027.1 tape measure protein [Escherichia coli]
MAEEVGGIVYEVGMDVKGLKAGQQSADKALSGLESSLNKTTGEFNKLDKGARNAGSGMKNAGGSANSLKTSITALAGAISISLVMGWGKTFLTVADNMTQLQARIARLSTDAAAAKQSFSDLTAIASRTGASLSDTTKLWESLTSSLKEAGATNAQVLNLTDTLQKIGRIGGSSTEEMANALRQFGQSIASGTIRAEEFNSILEQMPELARQIATGLGMSMGQLRQAMLDGKLTAQDALNAIQDRTSQINSEFSKLPRTMSQATNSLEVSFATLVAAINNATGASTTMVSIVDSLTSALDRLQGKAMTTSQQIADLASTGEMYARRARTWSWIGVDGWAAQNTGLSRAASLAVDLAGDMQKVTAETGKADDATKHFKIKGAGSTKLTKEQKAAAAAAKKAANEQESIAQKLQKMKEASEIAVDSTKELSKEQAILRAQQSLGKGATDEQIKQAGDYAAKVWDLTEGLKAQVAADKARKELQKDFQGVQAKVSPVSGLDAQYKEQMLVVNQYAMAYPAKVAEAEAARALIEKQYREQRLAASWAEWQQQNLAAQLFGETLDASLSTVSNSITGVLTGTQSINDALANVATTVLNTVVNSFVQMGADWVRSAVMGQTATTAAVAASTAAQTAGLATTTAASTASAATTTAAWTPAAIVASIGSFGGAAAIGLGAVLGALAMGVAGKRKNGGPMSAGSMYEVGENGLPEIFQASNGRQYMVPGNGGQMFSNKDVTSGSGSSGGGLVVYNNVTNNANARVSTSATQNGDGSVTISTIVDDIQSGGQISQAISTQFDTQRRATE